MTDTLLIARPTTGAPLDTLLIDTLTRDDARAITTVIDDAPPISLEEMLRDAALLVRVDRKYLLNRSELAVLTGTLGATVSVLTIEGRRSFGYASTYFDTPALEAYTSAGRHRRRRFKVRTREYLDTGDTYLEVKTRGRREVTVKERILHDGPPEVLGAAGHAFAADRLAAHLVPIDPTTLAPVLRTTYRRTTLHVAAHHGRPATRATIDTRLGWVDLERGTTIGGSPQEPITVRGGELVIVETKGLAVPSPIDRTLWRLGHRPTVISKYGAGLASLRPDLPPLKWHRLVETPRQPNPPDPQT